METKARDALEAQITRLKAIGYEIGKARGLPKATENSIRNLTISSHNSFHNRPNELSDAQRLIIKNMVDNAVALEVAEAEKARDRELARIARELDGMRDKLPGLIAGISAEIAALVRELEREVSENAGPSRA
jgi:hypothetical protein